MAIVWTYAPATNIATVTGGTSGTPATFATLVTADHAGTLDLVSRAGIAGTDGAPVATTYPLRPTEAFVLGGVSNSLYVTVSAWVNMTGATIKVVGTDGNGTAINELIVITGNGTYQTTLMYHTVVSTQVTVWTGTGSFTYKLTQNRWGIVWNFSGGQYRVDANIVIGDGATSTYFTSKSEQVTWVGNVAVSSTVASVLQIGTKVTSSSAVDGSTWNLIPSTSGFVTLNFHGRVLAYAWYFRQDFSVSGASHWIPLFDNTLNTDEYIQCRTAQMFQFNFLTTPAVFSKNIFSQGISGQPVVKFAAFSSSIVGSDITAASSPIGFGVGSFNPAYLTTIYRLVVDTCTTHIRVENANASQTLYYFIDTDPGVDFSTLVFSSNGPAVVYRQYSCDIKVADPTGTVLAGVTVVCKDQGGNTVFSVATDGSGNIAQQIVTYKTYTYNAGGTVVATFSPHTFTFSKVGYQTLVLENITVDHPLVWYQELQTPSGGGDAIILG